MKINIALIQLDVGPDKRENLSKAEHYVMEAARNKVDVVTLPEMFNWIGPFSETRKVAEDESGPSISMLKKIARGFRCYIVGGSILEQNGKKLPFNTTYFINRQGSIAAKYSKLHLFDYNVKKSKGLYGTNSDISYEESKAMCPGRNLSVVKTPFGKVGFAICNDLRYPEMFRKMTLAGCNIIFNCSAFTERTGKEHWRSLNRVRAFENQLYIVSTNQSGYNADGLKYYGHSMVVDPWGKVLTEGPPNGDVILYTKIDLGNVKEIRTQLPALKKIRKTYKIL